MVLVNRILLKDKLVDIKEDTNLFIKESGKYEINIYESKVNILAVLENEDDITVSINIYGGEVSYNSVCYSGKNQKIEVNLNKENSSIIINNSLVSINKQDVFISINHNAVNTHSDVYNAASTALNGSVLFDVVSKVLKGMKGCTVNQDSRIVSLNDTNKNKVNPILLIDEYDTSARHSCFIGKFNEDEVFYMATRGIKKKDAYNLLLNGFLIGKLDISVEEKENLKEKLNSKWR